MGSLQKANNHIYLEIDLHFLPYPQISYRKQGDRLKIKTQPVADDMNTLIKKDFSSGDDAIVKLELKEEFKQEIKEVFIEIKEEVPSDEILGARCSNDNHSQLQRVLDEVEQDMKEEVKQETKEEVKKDIKRFIHKDERSINK